MTKTMTFSERPKLSVPQFMGLAWGQFCAGAREAEASDAGRE